MTLPSLTRREVLKTTAISAVSATGLASCRPDTSPAGGASSGRTVSAVATPGLVDAARRPRPADWRALERLIDGDVVRRHDVDFDTASRLFNPRFDHVRPLAVVEVTSADDIGETIRFARRFGLNTRPKAGGHSYVGASTVSDGLVIDVGRIKAVRYHAGDKSANIGAGAGLYAVHTALARHGRTIPTGTCPTVGVAGYTLGGGIGVASREYGLTSDRLTGLTIVTADGHQRFADAHHERDLFWACRGGGGGNFGVVMSLRFDTQPVRRTGLFLLTFPWPHASAVIRGWAARVTVMKPSSWANLHLEARADGSTAVRVVGVCRAGDEDHEAAAMQAAAGLDASSVSTFDKSFLDGVAFLGGGTTSARQTFAAGSDVVASMTPGLSRLLARIVGRRARRGQNAAVILDPLTGAVQRVATQATAFPWRHHLCDIQYYVGLPEHATHASVSAAYGWIRSAHSRTRHAQRRWVCELSRAAPTRSRLLRPERRQAQADQTPGRPEWILHLALHNRLSCRCAELPLCRLPRRAGCPVVPDPTVRCAGERVPAASILIRPTQPRWSTPGRI